LDKDGASNPLLWQAPRHVSSEESRMSDRTARPRVEIWADGASLDGVVEHRDGDVVRGFTTNPTLMRDAGVTDYERAAREIIEAAGDLPVSVEVLADDVDGMGEQARKISSWGDNVVVKVPVTTSLGEWTGNVTRELTAGGMRVNVTAVMTAAQIERCAADLDGTEGSYVSVFAGRIADTGRDPSPTLRAGLAALAGRGPRLVWASAREVRNVYEAADIGCPVITLTHNLLRKLPLAGKDLETYSLETVAMFRSDAVAAGYTL
jgi:transaldolase